ncbi:hypothetical protein [Aurantivibrio plasticivorans]
MKIITIISTFLLFNILSFDETAYASSGYEITGRQGVMYFVEINETSKDNEDIFRIAVSEVCAGKSICQVQFWVGEKVSGFPLTDHQINSKLVQWKQNMNTGLRKWLVKCDSTKLFSSERECM